MKYYPIKNTKIVDSALCINGLNLAVGGGLNGLIFTSDGKMLVPVDFFEQFKCPINKHNWIFSTGRIDYNQLPDINSKDEFSADAVIGTGFQITRKLYTTLSIGAFYYKTTQEYLVPFDVYSETIEGYSLRLPMQWGYNLNKKWKLFLYGDVSYQTPRAITTSWALGSDFYW